MLKETQEIKKTFEHYLIPEEYLVSDCDVPKKWQLNVIGHNYTELDKTIDNIFLNSFREMEKISNYTENELSIINLLEKVFLPPSNIELDERKLYELKQLLINQYIEVKELAKTIYEMKSKELLGNISS